MNQIQLTGTYVQIGAAVSYLIVQASMLAEVYVGAVAPAESVQGFLYKPDTPRVLPNITPMGGNIWVRGDGVLRYSTAA